MSSGTFLKPMSKSKSIASYPTLHTLVDMSPSVLFCTDTLSRREIIIPPYVRSSGCLKHIVNILLKTSSTQVMGADVSNLCSILRGSLYLIKCQCRKQKPNQFCKSLNNLELKSYACVPGNQSINQGKGSPYLQPSHIHITLALSFFPS